MEDKNYYAEQLNSQMLFQVYDTKIPRIDQYLEEEINKVKKDLKAEDKLLEVGCGYGRILKKLAGSAGSVKGIDISKDSINFAKDYLKDCKNVELEVADFHTMKNDEKFDVIILLQNALSAIKGDPKETIAKSLSMLKDSGKLYISTYSKNFWDQRIEWFEEQADKKLLGQIDYDKTKDGVIICKDGFKAITFTEEDFEKLAKATGYKYSIEEVDGSSLFLIIKKEKANQ